MAEWEEVEYWPDGKDQKALRKNFTFSDFKTALEFVNKIGKLAEESNHHPDINLGWGYVQVWLTSHDAHGITKKDHLLAKEIDQLQKSN
ncbi:MAG: 4a-hydroxytetrahydrobiopterin dehydratase [bacterium]|nr:4a-hydroxytetrahydrobiopterin dehydratase [bacterium]